jgi:hypothetical protein
MFLIFITFVHKVQRLSKLKCGVSAAPCRLVEVERTNVNNTDE